MNNQNLTVEVKLRNDQVCFWYWIWVLVKTCKLRCAFFQCLGVITPPLLLHLSSTGMNCKTMPKYIVIVIVTAANFSDLTSEAKKVALLQFRHCCMSPWRWTAIIFWPPMAFHRFHSPSTQIIAAKYIFMTKTMQQCKSKQSWLETPSLTGHVIKRDTINHFQWH